MFIIKKINNTFVDIANYTVAIFSHIKKKQPDELEDFEIIKFKSICGLLDSHIRENPKVLKYDVDDVLLENKIYPKFNMIFIDNLIFLKTQEHRLKLCQLYIPQIHNFNFDKIGKIKDMSFGLNNHITITNFKSSVFESETVYEIIKIKDATNKTIIDYHIDTEKYTKFNEKN